MKTYIYAFIALAVYASASMAQIPFWHQTNGPEAGTLRDITIDSTGRVFVWTQGSGVYVSSDNGSTWNLMNAGLPTLNMKRGVSAPFGFLFAENNQNQIFRINPNVVGAQWKEVTPVKDTTITQYDMLSDSSGAIYLATTHGVQRSDDNGKTWQQKNTNLRDSIKKNLIDSSTIFLASDGNGNIFAALQYGGIFRSSDKGESWRKLPSRNPDGTQINALAATGNGNIIIGNIQHSAIEGGKIYVSTDTGRTWVAVYQRPSTTQEIKNNIDKIVRVPGSNILYANAHGPTLRSSDNGITWAVMDTNKRGDEPFSMGVRGNTIFQLSEPDGIFLSTDNGTTWTSKNKGLFAQFMWDIAMNSKQELFGITEYGLHRSTDNGDSWDQAPEYGETYFPSIFIDKKDILYIGTSYGLFRSKDNGNTLDHIVINLDTTLTYNVIIQTGADATGKLYCSSILPNLGFISSTDDGDHWTKVTNLPEQNTGINAFAFASSDTILLASSVSSYYRSIDNGKTWSLLSTNNNGTYQLLIHPDGSYLSRVKNGGNAGVFRSTDGAQTWFKIFPPTEGFPFFNTYYSMMIDQSGRIIVCTDSGIYRSDENTGFSKWSSISTGMTANDFPNHYINASGVVENPLTHVFFAASRGLSVFKSIPDFDTTQVRVADLPSPVSSLSLSSQPNPFSQSSNIGFTSDHEENTVIDVYDVLGRKVRTLFSGIAEKGEHRLIFDGSLLTSGNYLIVLRSGNQTTSSWVTLSK